MTKALAQTYTTAIHYRTQISTVLMAACLLLAFIYAANIYSTISHTVTLQHIQTQEASLGSAVESLDSQYLVLSSKITPDALHAYGLSAGQVSAFINRPSASRRIGAMALSGHEL